MRRGARDVIIFYQSTLHSMLNFDLQIFGFRKEKRKKGESPVFQSTYRLKDGHISWLRRQIAALAPPMLGLWAQRPPGTARSSRVSPALAPPPAAASTYPRSPGREWDAAFTPAEEAPAAPWSPAPQPLPLGPLARRALSSSCKLSDSAVDKKPGRPSANLPGAGWGN